MEITRSLGLTGIGPLAHADVEFGDLTILVGPQATGKSIFLQALKLVADNGAAVDSLHKHGMTWHDLPDFLDLFFGEGMRSLWQDDDSRVTVDGQDIDLGRLARRYNWTKTESIYYVPAQRVLVLGNGWPRPFSDYAARDPFVVRDFSENIRDVVESDLAKSGLFLQQGRLKAELRDLINQHVYRGFDLRVDAANPQRRLVLASAQDGGALPYMVWSAGQREFTPLLLGLYHLLPAGKVQRRNDYRWVILEEPEMGLHPAALQVVLLAVLDLLSRGYRVCLSTHSPQVLDLAWVLRALQTQRSPRADLLLRLFEVPRTGPMRRLTETALQKSTRVYYFD
ncbi:MAG: ATP-binding protein, partial [Fimbriimonadaceae bacterium]|nr:ATP-binding protein [Fimbriimonadaceae bacterium]